jgi:uncharacterized protein Yka (UPF0111/DUF47 family)
MKRPGELYEKRVSITLAGFQVTELLLKDYIATSYEVMRKLLDGYIDFSPSRKDIENHSLERLISTFKTINGNRKLIKNLQSVVEHRNRLAHRALLPLYGSKTPDKEYWKLIDEISPLEGEIDKCMTGIQQELIQLRQRVELVLRNDERSG